VSLLEIQVALGTHPVLFLNHVVDRHISAPTEGNILSFKLAWVFGVLNFHSVSKLDIVWVQLREVVQHLIVNELSHVFYSDVGPSDHSIGCHQDLFVDNALFEVALLLYVELDVVSRLGHLL
jgi:hypothetical protein